MLSKAALTCSQLTTQTAGEFLASLPRGAYTTARVLKQTHRIFELERQVDRLVFSCQQFLAGAKVERTELSLKLGVLSVIEQTLASSPLLASSDCKLTVLIAVRYPDVEVYAHLEAMKTRAAEEPVHVALSSNPQVSRHNAEVKDSKWVDDRVQVVDPTAEETLLLDPLLGEILEGSQTNFFAVNDQGHVVTAKTGILLGTVRAAVMDACRALEIPVVEAPPLVSNIPHFAEAFLASTSRLVLSIDTIGDVALPANRPVTQRIAQWVSQHVDDRSISPRQLLRKL